jgi:hypothetical protein
MTLLVKVLNTSYYWGNAKNGVSKSDNVDTSRKTSRLEEIQAKGLTPLSTEHFYRFDGPRRYWSASTEFHQLQGQF